MTNIFFRTDGNKEIATGHIMRCLTIARACKKKGASVKFVVSDTESVSLLQERFLCNEEFPVCCLHSNYREMTIEVPALTSLLKAEDNGNAKPWLFIDSYFATPAYFDMLSPYCKTAYLDDLRSFDCNVDLVVNYDTDQECAFYQNAADRLLGIQYAPLREQFQNPVYEVRPEVKNILLSTGGTDPYGIAEKILDAVSEIPLLQTMHYHIITAGTNTRYNVLQAMSDKNPRIRIHKGVTDMASLMASCDLAVSAGGTTLCELCAVGVPTVSFLMADNQHTAIETFSVKKLIPCAGDVRNNTAGKEVIEHITDFLTRMSQNADSRKKSSHAMRAFLDGCGAAKIADRLLFSSKSAR